MGFDKDALWSALNRLAGRWSESSWGHLQTECMHACDRIAALESEVARLRAQLAEAQEPSWARILLATVKRVFPSECVDPSSVVEEAGRKLAEAQRDRERWNGEGLEITELVVEALNSDDFQHLYSQRNHMTGPALRGILERVLDALGRAAMSADDPEPDPDAEEIG